MSNRQRNQCAQDDDRSGTQDHVLVYIDNMLCGELPAPQEHEARHQLSRVNERSYEPEILNISPYHYENDKYKSMEEQKIRYMKQLLRRRNEESVDRHMATLRELEQLARNCYAETIDHLSQEKFLVPMLIDGCFVFEFFRKYNTEEPRDKDDPLMESDWIQFCLQRDLLLLENQLLFFVLNKLYELTKGLIDIATRYFNSELGDSSRNQMLGESKHLLHLMHTCWTARLPNGRRQNHRTKLNMFVSTATELRESGVKLRVRQACDLMDLKFEDEILRDTDRDCRGHHQVTNSKPNRVRVASSRWRNQLCNGVYVIHGLPQQLFKNSSKDVRLLCQSGIIKNLLGDDEAVAQRFNKMGDGVTLSNFYYYDDIHYRVNEYCKERWNVWMVKVRREYFHSPWAFLSILAATLLFLLTAVQTVFTINSGEMTSPTELNVINDCMMFSLGPITCVL